MGYTIDDVRSTRIENGISQQDFARLMGIPKATWGHMELGNSNATKDVIAKAIHLLKTMDCEIVTNTVYRKGAHALVDGFMYKKKKEIDIVEKVDTRYKVQKPEVHSTEEQVNKVISENQIYRDVRSRMNRAQFKQVAYGLEKYPEPLNQNTWSVVETIDHIIDETIDKLHYLTMLKVKLEEGGKL